MRATLQNVAEHAHVSIATASRALNGIPVSSTSKERVDRAVSELGYIANDAARTLRRERTMTMGLIFSDLSNTLGLGLVDSLSESIEDAGYSLLISSARGDADRYDLLMRRFLERRADALFCMGPVGPGTFLGRYELESTPVLALFGGSDAYATLPTIGPSLVEAATALARHLGSGGHRRVAVLESPPGPGPQALRKALAAQRIEVIRTDVSESGSTRDSLVELLARDRRPTALVAPDPAVRGVLAACAALHIDVPGELAVVGLCDTTADDHFHKHDVSTLAVDPHRMGRAAGSSMLAWLEGERPPRKTRVSTGIFTARRSSETTYDWGNP